MGYRSDVKYVICLPSDEAYTKYMAEVNLILADKPDVRDILEKLSEDVTHDNREDEYKHQIRVYWDYVKWYNDYDWVKIQHEIMELAEQYDGAWFFSRMGEEDDDYETNYDCQKGLCTQDFIELRRRTAFI